MSASSVIDASAMVELLIGAAGAGPVAAAISRRVALAPDVFDGEVLHALSGMARGRRLDAAGSRAAVQSLSRAPLTRIPSRPFLLRAWDLRASLSIYDAIYVALAQVLGANLVTADRRLARAPRLGVSVTLLSQA